MNTMDLLTFTYNEDLDLWLKPIFHCVSKIHCLTHDWAQDEEEFEGKDFMAMC